MPGFKGNLLFGVKISSSDGSLTSFLSEGNNDERVYTMEQG